MNAILYNKPELKKTRRNLRNNLTASEAALWSYLQDRKLHGRKFRRQASIGNYVVDFYCPSEKLAVELDGEVHLYESVNANDTEKESFLAEKGITVVRFENQFVFQDLERVLIIISNHFNRGNNLLTTPTPP